jgi:phosphatidylserine/phosphatidylglycerophosphate/cardiolipin synthase-like enzyme
VIPFHVNKKIIMRNSIDPLVTPIYVHSKLIIVDDEYVMLGSTNMDNMSFFYSSELHISVYNENLAKNTKVSYITLIVGLFIFKGKINQRASG